MTRRLLERKAQTIIVSSVLYYAFDLSPIEDAEFDRLCKEVCEEWSGLSPLRQWQLGSPEDLQASGYHIATTWLTTAWALEWASRLGHPQDARGIRKKPWKWSARHKVHWLGVSQLKF